MDRALRLKRLLSVRPLIALITCITVIACSSDKVGITNPADQLLMVRMNRNAVTLSTIKPYDTISLSALAYTGTGQLIPDIVPAFTSSSESVHVTDDGFVTAYGIITDAFVVATYRYKTVSRSDTTWINVTQSPAPASLSSFSVSLDTSAGAPINEDLTVNISAIDINSRNISSRIAVNLRVSDERIAKVDRSKVFNGITAEEYVTIYASATVFGVDYVDSFTVKTDWPLQVVVAVVQSIDASGSPTSYFNPSSVTIYRGGTLVICNCKSLGVHNPIGLDIVFDRPENALISPLLWFPTATGNIEMLLGVEGDPFSSMQARSFSVPGTYTFKSVIGGISGTLTVK